MNFTEIEQKLNTDLFFFAEEAPLLIKDKAGSLIKWKPNLAQRYMHERLEEQRAKTGGWVRAVLLKGRQQGGSTYVGMRYYHRTRSVPGTSTFILSHEGKTTSKLFAMVERAHANVLPEFLPVVGKSNVNQLTFPGLGSDYAVGTAGNENVGRGGTAQLFHGSEVAYWEHAYAIQDGALESIGLLPGTEIILESTANGPLGLFYDKAMAALKGIGDYILIFIPWFWQDEYERAYDGTPLSPEEEEFSATYFGKAFPFERLPPAKERVLRKVMWRRHKVIDLATSNGGLNLGAGRAKFRQIYPSNAIEAFQSTGEGLFSADAIMSARKSTITDEVSPLIAGVDPAGDSEHSDRTVIALRRGRHIEEILVYPKMRPMLLAGIIANDIIAKRNADMVFIDRGYGEGTIDRLQELGFGRKVVGIAFNESPLNPDVYLNKRSEIIIECAKWLNAGDVRIPDLDDVHADFSCIPLDETTSNGLKFIPSKREIKKRLGGRSTDIVDAAALTFSYPVRRDDAMTSGRFRKAQNSGGLRRAGSTGPLSSMARKRGGTLE